MHVNGLGAAILAALAVGGVAYAFVLPYLSGENKAEKRQAALTLKANKRIGERPSDTVNRRKQVTDSLKDIEARANKKQSLEARIAQAGLKWTKQKYFIVSAILGAVMALLAFVVDGNILISLAAAIAG